MAAFLARGVERPTLIQSTLASHTPGTGSTANCGCGSFSRTVALIAGLWCRRRRIHPRRHDVQAPGRRRLFAIITRHWRGATVLIRRGATPAPTASPICARCWAGTCWTARSTCLLRLLPSISALFRNVRHCQQAGHPVAVDRRTVSVSPADVAIRSSCSAGSAMAASAAPACCGRLHVAVVRRIVPDRDGDLLRGGSGRHSIRRRGRTLAIFWGERCSPSRSQAVAVRHGQAVHPGRLISARPRRFVDRSARPRPGSLRRCGPAGQARHRRRQMGAPWPPGAPVALENVVYFDGLGWNASPPLTGRAPRDHRAERRQPRPCLT